MDHDRLIKQIRKLNRTRSFYQLVNALGTRRLTHSEQMRFLERLYPLILDKSITPREAKILTKMAISGPAREKTQASCPD